MSGTHPSRSSFTVLEACWLNRSQTHHATGYGIHRRCSICVHIIYKKKHILRASTQIYFFPFLSFLFLPITPPMLLPTFFSPADSSTTCSFFSPSDPRFSFLSLPLDLARLAGDRDSSSSSPPDLRFRSRSPEPPAPALAPADRAGRGPSVIFSTLRLTTWKRITGESVKHDPASNKGSGTGTHLNVLHTKLDQQRLALPHAFT